MSRPASTRWQLLWQGIAIWAGILLSGCRPLGTPPGSPDAYGSFPVPKTVDIQDNNDKLPYTYHHIRRAIAIREYFEYMDTLVAHFDSLLPYPINEHLIVRANPW
ncbi:MAG: hypothetical protein KDD15_30240, partial [Lewinella sp.]|nr:hypothetical protein [Lewinella sp.]